MDKSKGLKLIGVSELGEGYPVEIVCRQTEGYRWAIRAKNEGGNNDTLVDFWEFIDWLRFGPYAGRLREGFCLPYDENCFMED